MSSSAGYETILTNVTDRVGVVTLNRPKALNALSTQLMREVVHALTEMDRSKDVRSIVVTGAGSKAFAAGADIKEMATKEYAQVLEEQMFSLWDSVRAVRKPIIAAVNGYALGGGCELAMLCDLIFAAESATFGQPEVQLGVIPAMGGTQRLTRLVGRAVAMDVVLGGLRLDARAAAAAGLVSRVLPDERLMLETLEVHAREHVVRYASKIAGLFTPGAPYVAPWLQAK